MNAITSIDIKQVSKYFPANGQRRGFKALDNLEAFLISGRTPPDLVTAS